MDLKRLNTLVSECGLISQIEKISGWNDDPPLIKFVTKLNSDIKNGDGLFPDSGSAGVSLDSEVAVKKAIFEGLERISLSYFTFHTFICDSYAKLSRKSSTLSPSKFCYLMQDQLHEKNFENFSFSESEKFYWTQCHDLFSHRLIYIPAQLIYCPYKYVDEKIICLPISTGTALGCSREEALYKGICEVIERDAFITNYLLSMSPKKIKFESMTEGVKKYLSKFRKFRLKTDCYILESDIRIPTVLTVISDHHITAPAVTIGLKTEVNFENAVIGSIEEAFQIRTWIRRCLVLQNFRGETYSERVILRRALFWANPGNTHLLNFILKTKNKFIMTASQLSKYKTTNYHKKLLRVKKILKKKNLGVYYKEITHPLLKNKNVYVIKTLIPALQPHFIDEEYPYYGGKRLERLKNKYGQKINLFPHPFL